MKTRLWMRNEPELGLLGFATREDRDRFSRGEPGPFERVVAEDGRTILQNEDYHGMIRRLVVDSEIKS